MARRPQSVARSSPVLSGLAVPALAPHLPLMLPLILLFALQDNPVVGTWKLADEKLKTDGPREIVIRPDSSASWGKEHSRWRILPGGQIKIAVGGEWETYKYKVKGTKLTISGGDLTDPVTLLRTGPPSPRPANVPVPPDPDATM